MSRTILISLAAALALMAPLLPQEARPYSLESFPFDPRGLAVKAKATSVATTGTDDRGFSVQVGDYATTFSALTSWTMRQLTWRGNVIDQAGSGTYLQTVLHENHGQKADGKAVDPFLGTGHRPEQVDELVLGFYDGTQLLEKKTLFSKADGDRLTVDPKSQRPLALIPSFKLGRGNVLVVLKKSRLVSTYNGLLLSLEHATVFSSEGVEQYARLTGGDGDLGKIVFAYPLMHMLPNATATYFAHHGTNHIEEGSFKDDGSMGLKKEITSLVTWDTATKTGIHVFHTTPYPGGVVNIWNRNNDNKLYFRYPVPKAKDQTLEYRLFVTAFPCGGMGRTAEADGWVRRDLVSGSQEVPIWVAQP